MGAEGTGVIEAARAIRPYLPCLLGPSAAAGLDRRLTEELIGLSDGPVTTAATVGRLRALLEAQEDTAWFLAEVLRDTPEHRPPYHQPRYTRRHTGDTASPAGDPGPVGAARYACPHGDYVWYRPDVATPVPACPTHQAQLARG